MKRLLLFLCALTITCFITAQERFIARGADPGEFYISSDWYGIYNPMMGPPFYDTLQTAIFRFTENGKKLTIQYEANKFLSDPIAEMYPEIILADATPGVLYNRCVYLDYYAHTQLWVSFDYGKNWMLRESNIGRQYYYSSNVEGLIYRAASEGYNIGTYKSYDYAESFTLIDDKKINANDYGFDECDFFFLFFRGFYHTYDCF
jgi:hypothetical protein